MNSKLIKLFGFSFALAVLAVPFGSNAKLVKGDDILEGSGTVESPYLIKKASDFKLFDVYVENREAGDKFYKLANDITIEQEDLSDQFLFNIGNNNEPFTGSFDGDGHTITLNNLLVSNSSFFYEPKGTIQNIVFNGKVSASGGSFGIVAVFNYATIKNCESYVDIVSKGTNLKGGVFTSRNYGTINKCYNYGDFTSKGTETGGITALNCSEEEEGYTGKIINCINHGTIKHNGDNSHLVSGVVANNLIEGDPTIVSNCVNFGDIIGEHEGDIVSGILNGPAETITSQNNKCLINYGKVVSNNATEGEGVYGCITTTDDECLKFGGFENLIRSVREDDHYSCKGDCGPELNVKPEAFSGEGSILTLNDVAGLNNWNPWYLNTVNLPTLHNEYYGMDQDSTFKDTFYITDDTEIGTLVGTGCTLDFSYYDSFDDFELRLFNKEGRNLAALAGDPISSSTTYKKVIAGEVKSKTFLWKLSEFSQYEYITFEEVDHEFITIEGKEPKCEAGYKSAVFCVGCGDYWSDLNQNQYIGSTEEDYNNWISKGKGFLEEKHNLKKISGYAATCYADGLKDFYECEDCGMFFEDEDCKVLIGDEFAKDTWAFSGGRTIPAHHNEEPVKTDEVEATCTESGCKAYWYCPDCENYFSDEVLTEANKIGNAEALAAWKVGAGKIDATGHNATKQDGKAATSSSEGYKEYYLCENCNKYFEDEACTIEIIDLEAWKLNEGKIDKNGLSGGAIAGIAVGSTAVVGLGGFSLFWFGFKKRSWAELVALLKKYWKALLAKFSKKS